MQTYRQTAQDTARDVIVSFRDLASDERPAALAQLSRAAQTSPTANSIRGKALIQFWEEAARAVALDTEHTSGTYAGTIEAHGNAREAAFNSAGDALFAVIVSVVPVTAAGLLAGTPAQV